MADSLPIVRYLVEKRKQDVNAADEVSEQSFLLWFCKPEFIPLHWSGWKDCITFSS